MQSLNSQFVGWTAVAGGIVAVIGFVSLILLFIVGEPFGTINDLLSIPTAALMLPLVFALRRLNAPLAPVSAWVAFVAGLVGFVTTAVGSILLVSGRIDFNSSLVYAVGGFGLVGLWALLSAIAGLRGHYLPAGVAWLAILPGAFLALLLPLMLSPGRVGAALSGMAEGAAPGPVMLLVLGMGFISYAALPIWFILMGRLALAERLGEIAAAFVTP